MPLDSQFNLSLEISKVLPLGPLIGAAGQGILNLARDLRNSGSDIAVEEDLAMIFGRNRIESRFASTFRTSINKSSVKQIGDFADIVLEIGSGPTVRRSLQAQNQAYFSTVVQLSLLAFTHELQTLAWALARAQERRLKDAPPELQRLPSAESIFGTLRACQEQTAAFNWNLILDAVERVLVRTPNNSKDETTRDPVADRIEGRKLAFPVLLGCLDMLAALQSWPDDRIVHIYASSGYATIITWANHVLGLTVEIQDRNLQVGHKFGNGNAQIILCINFPHTSICMLDAQEGDILRITPDDSDPPLSAELRLPALGYGREVLRITSPNRIFDSKIHQRTEARRIILEAIQNWRNCGLSEYRLLEAAAFFFDGIDLDPNELRDLAQQKSGGKSKFLSIVSQDLSIILASFASIMNFESCVLLPLCFPSHAMREDNHFTCLCSLLLGRESSEHDIDKMALVSAQGWSIYRSSFGISDPEDADPECLLACAGVPSRNGERARFISDGPSCFLPTRNGPLIQQGLLNVSADCMISKFSNVERKTFIGLSNGVFRVTMSFQCFGMEDCRLGFRSMIKLRSDFKTLDGSQCRHEKSEVNPEDISFLSQTCQTMAEKPDTAQANFVDKLGSGPILLFQSSNRGAARWWLLSEVCEYSKYRFRSARRAYRETRLFLKGHDCCVQCAVTHARHIVDDATKPTDIYIIL